MFRRVIIAIVRCLIWLRYRLIIEGWQTLEEQMKNKKGILFLPNHSAEIDPVLVMSVLWTKFCPHPVVVDDFFYMTGIRFFMRLVGAVPCPNMEYGVNHWKLTQLKKLQECLVSGLREGRNYLVYPSGKLKVEEREVIGGASFIPALLLEVPEAKIVLVRITGLWGSRFSRALTGKVPDLVENLRAAASLLVKNALVLMPRRRVRIEFHIPEDFPRTGDRALINSYLENWYNAIRDPLTLLPNFFWKKELPAITAPLEKTRSAASLRIPQDLQEEIVRKIAELANLSPARISVKQQMIRDLGLDSLDVTELLLFLEEKYEVEQLPLESLATVGDLLQAVVGKQEEEEQTISGPPLALPKEKNRSSPQPPQGETIVEAFFQSCDRLKTHVACVDALSGVIHYRKAKTAVILLAKEIAKMPGKNVGIMLPSSVGVYLTILATLFAGKIPVMLNWTVGVKAVNHAVDVTGIKVILSSRNFINRLKSLDIGSAEEKILFLEEVREQLSKAKKIGAYLKSYRHAKSLLNHSPLKGIASTDTAVILFTSGTETLPKGVPLSHENILSNQSAALQTIPLQADDFLYGVLPPFHSFGFSVTGLLPLLAGIKVFYAPDPTNYRGMAQDIATYKPTCFFCAPTFIRALFHTASPHDLRSLRLIVTGSEKAPKELFDYVRRFLPHTQLLEGYGITECSPIVSLCREGTQENGVGEPLPGIELLIIDPETQMVLSQGKEGEVCIAGPNVFAGYLGTKIDPFISKDGKKWYRSSDRGYLNKKGSLILTGRLKRFVKMGGEMISLGGLEEEIAFVAKEQRWSSSHEGAAKGQGPGFALCCLEKEGKKAALILYTIYKIDKEMLNEQLKNRGHSNLMRIAEVRTIPQIPLTGTGKTNYRLLEESNTNHDAV